MVLEIVGCMMNGSCVAAFVLSRPLLPGLSAHLRGCILLPRTRRQGHMDQGNHPPALTKKVPMGRTSHEEKVVSWLMTDHEMAKDLYQHKRCL
jgi:hypothetical protein